jgi:hypothetical protein
MNEEWRPAPGLEGRYEVSNLGGIRHAKTGKPAHRKLLNVGYYCIGVRIAPYRSAYPTIHRLVATAFVPNPLGRPQVDHIDRDRLNNRADNLRWVSTSNQAVNKKRRCDNSSGQPGVYWVPRRNAWRAEIKYAGFAKYLGQFKSFDEAVAARKSAEARIHMAALACSASGSDLKMEEP